jgi:hypothetical protein
MKKTVIPRLAGLLVLYCVVFIALVVFQFAKKGIFTQQIGGMTVSGQYRLSAERELPATADELVLTGGAVVRFGGLELNLKNREDLFNDQGFVLVDSDGGRRAAIPEYMIRSGDTVRFRLSGGTELVFSSLVSNNGPELRIAAFLEAGVFALEIPFKPRRSSIVRDAENGRLGVLYNGLYFQFSHFARWEEQGRLVLNSHNSSVSYRVRSERKTFNPGDFIISRALTGETFSDALAQLLDRQYALWSRVAPAQIDEDLAVAYGGESLRRGSYRAAVASLASAFPPAGRTYESSVYLGGMSRVLRSFTTTEREEGSRITRLLNAHSPDLLREPHIVAFFADRGLTAEMNSLLGYAASIDPESLTLDLVPGIFEGYTDLKGLWSGLRPGAANPFEALIERARLLVAEGIAKDAEQDLVFVYDNGSAESEFNLRLGNALRLWAEAAGDGDWAALGRSLILSVLSLTGASGSAPRALVRSENGETVETQDDRISAARLYRLLNPGDYHPRATLIDSGTNAIWAWTAAPAVSAVLDTERLDISVSFPVNETHYMIIKGIRPFGRLQLYDVFFRSDSQFERYDSSGWIYFPEDRILMLKMKHRATTEHIRIFFRQEVEPAASTPREPPAGDGATATTGGTGASAGAAWSETGAP